MGTLKLESNGFLWQSIPIEFVIRNFSINLQNKYILFGRIEVTFFRMNLIDKVSAIASV